MSGFGKRDRVVGLTLRDACLTLKYLTAGGLSLGEAIEKAQRVAKLESFAEFAVGRIHPADLNSDSGGAEG